MAGVFVACSSCAVHVKANEVHCPYCGTAVPAEVGRTLGRATGAVLMGLTLASCQIEPDYGVPFTATTGAETDSATDGETSSTTTGDEAGTTTGGEGSTSSGGTSGSSTSSGGESDTDGTTGSTGSTSISPDYGVPTTGE